jgi:hypothetical protein
MPSDSNTPNLSFFGDSSSHGKAYMVAGGFAVAGMRISEIEDEIALLRDDAGIKSEFHWSDYRGGAKREAYERLVRYGFALINQRRAALHIIVAKFDGYNHKAKTGEGRETSVNRMYDQLLLHRLAQYYGQSRAIHVRLDAGNDSKDICQMRNQLCAAAYRKYKTRPNCIRSIEPVQSHRSGIVQMADVIVGAIAAKRNSVVHTSPKGGLADFVLKASGRSTWSASTPKNARFLTLWNFSGR